MVSNRQLQEREHRKELILTGALEAFAIKGIENATMDDIAQQSEFGKGTLYYYYTSKDEIINAILEKGWVALWHSLEEIVNSQLSPRKKFIQILIIVAKEIKGKPNIYQFLFDAPKIVKSTLHNNQKWKSYQEKLYSSLRFLIEDGMSQGEFPKMDSHVLFKAIGGLFISLLFRGKKDEKISEHELEKLLNEMFTVSKYAPRF